MEYKSQKCDLSIPAFFVFKNIKVGGLTMRKIDKYSFEASGHEFESDVVEVVSSFAERE